MNLVNHKKIELNHCALQYGRIAGGMIEVYHPSCAMWQNA
jgi:hypothetical protein